MAAGGEELEEEIEVSGEGLGVELSKLRYRYTCIYAVDSDGSGAMWFALQGNYVK